MKWDKWRRSSEIGDYRDPNAPVTNAPEGATISETIKLEKSDLARDAGGGDVINVPKPA